jgi:hypothetical protein
MFQFGMRVFLLLLFFIWGGGGNCISVINIMKGYGNCCLTPLPTISISYISEVIFIGQPEEILTLNL